tara:strand:+ start:1913 stop:2056 length:144 start_codon:yes stop_codon:yes gene_type:complete
LTDSLKTIGTSLGTIAINVWQLVPEALGVVLIILNIVYVMLKIKKEY